MLSLLQNFRFLSVCMIVFLSLSIIFQTIAGVMIHVLLQESENMSMIRSNALKQCRQKYVNYYKLNGRMINTSVYVDKFIKKLKLLGIPLSRYLQLSGQMMFFFILSTGISIFLQLSFGKTLFDMVPYYLISILGLYLYFSVMSFTNLEEKKNLLKINLVDYLDNHLCPRLETERHWTSLGRRKLWEKPFLIERKNRESLIFPTSRSWKPCWRNSYTNHENKVRIALPVSSIPFSEFSD